jgi:hypothetical protein
MVVGFCVAVAFMAGWLVLTILLGDGGSTMMTADDDEVPAMATRQPPRVESQRISVSAPLVPPRQLLSPQADPGSWPGATAALAVPTKSAPAAPAAPALASLPAAPAVTAPDTVPAAPSPGTSVSINDRIAVGDIYAQVTNKISDEPVEALEIVPLPPHRPRASPVPFPRPRPQMEAQAQAQAEPPSFFDFLTGR